MYAVIQIKGHQHKVTIGEEIKVDRIEAKVGDKLEFPALLVVDNKTMQVGRDATQVVVVTEILSHSQGKKLEISRFRAKSRHRRKIGFRPQLTTLKIASIGIHKTSKK